MIDTQCKACGMDLYPNGCGCPAPSLQQTPAWLKNDTAEIEPVEVWYRFEDRRVSAGVDEWDNPLGPPSIYVYLSKYPVAKHTPKGVRLMNGRFIKAGTRKQFAYPTKEEAAVSFKARKRMQIKIYRSKIRQAETALQVIDNPLDHRLVGVK